MAAQIDQLSIVVGDQHQQDGRNQKLVGDRVEHPAHRGLLYCQARGEVAVEKSVMPAAEKIPQRRPPRPCLVRPEHQRDHDRHGCDAAVGQAGSAAPACDFRGAARGLGHGLKEHGGPPVRQADRTPALSLKWA